MGYSAFKLVAAAGDGKSIRNAHTQTSHGFVAGQAVRYDLISGNGWTGAMADTPENAEAVGVIEEVISSDEFVVVYQGEIETGNFEESYGVTGGANDVFFLSDSESGKLVSVPPTDGGSVIKPMLVRQDGNRALVSGYIGTVIGGKSTVSLDGVQPVGTILPYAGLTSDIPATWSECDGKAVSVNTYGDYYNRVGRRYGFHQTVVFSNESTVDLTDVDSATFSQVDSDLSVTGTLLSWNNDTRTAVLDVQHMDGNIPHTRKFNTIEDVTVTYTMAGTSTTVNFSIPTNATITSVKKPDLRGRVMIGGGEYASGVEYQLAQIGGVDEVILSETQLPAHTHSTTISISASTMAGKLKTEHVQNQSPADFYTHPAATSTSTWGAVYPNGPSTQSTITGSGNVSGTGTSTSVGGGEGHTNLQPYMTTAYIIRLEAGAAAAIIGDINASDNQLLDHNTPNPVRGDIIVHYNDGSGSSGEYRNFQLFDGISADGSDESFVRFDMNNKRLGVGTITPGATLDVVGNVDINNGSTSGVIINGSNDVTSHPDIYLNGRGVMVAGTHMHLGIDGTDSGTDARFVVQRNSLVQSELPENELLRLTETGELGIGSDVNGINPLDHASQPNLLIKSYIPNDGTSASDNNHIVLENTNSSSNFNALIRQGPECLKLETDSQGVLIKDKTVIGPDGTTPTSETTASLTVEGDTEITERTKAKSLSSTVNPVVFNFVTQADNGGVSLIGIQGFDDQTDTITVERTAGNKYVVTHNGLSGRINAGNVTSMAVFVSFDGGDNTLVAQARNRTADSFEVMIMGSQRLNDGFTPANGLVCSCMLWIPHANV